MNFDDALDSVTPPPRPEPEPDVPKGWEPGIRWSNETGEGEIVTPPLAEAPDAKLWQRIIDDFGLSPDELEIIDGSLSLIGWKSPVKGANPDDPPEKQTINLTRYKVRLRRRQISEDEAAKIDVEELCRLVREPSDPVPPIPHVASQDYERAMVVCCSDWQIGKGEGDGSRGTFDRIMESMDKVMYRINELAMIGRSPNVVYLVGMGDLIEQCQGHYASQTFTVDLNRRDQMKVVRRLFLRFVDLLVDDGLSVVLTGVPGNHGENRNGAGKAYTTVTDNDDLAVIEQVAEVLESNPERYANVSCVLPDDYSMTLDIGGVPVGFFHGHVTKGGATAQKKMEDWWKGQIMGNRPTVRDARILVTAHYHHLCLSEASGRTWIQCPAMDPGSHWWTSLTGQHSPSGMLTFLTGDHYGPRGYGDLLLC